MKYYTIPTASGALPLNPARGDPRHSALPFSDYTPSHCILDKSLELTAAVFIALRLLLRLYIHLDCYFLRLYIKHCANVSKLLW